ncbi:hypothetical protein H6G76_29705 [Nostoc sp. FACHB-152]|uniref:hypothetical protein n=1 Tax=Nostoc sp. FACHB-152 TaxID=2692837 RepID=UPI001689BE4D|nr:hypothetical protein [Nostoc sp. FACHB-152]MBD2451233.1 hypothetical protein [Nostoc sp. FACHB-152]
MPYTTPAQQPLVRSTLPHLKRITATDEQAIAQAELNKYVAEQAQAVAPTTDPLTSRDRRIIGEIIEVDPESIRTLWIEGGITVWVQLKDGGRLPFERNWFAARVQEVKATLPETPRERNERLSEELETACQKYGLTHGEIDWLSFSTTLYVNRQRLGFLGCNLQGQWYSRISQLGGSRTAVDIDAAIAQLGIRQAVAA